MCNHWTQDKGKEQRGSTQLHENAAGTGLKASNDLVNLVTSQRINKTEEVMTKV